MHWQQQGEAIVWLSVDHTGTRTSGCVFLSHRLQKIICFTGKAGGRNREIFSGGGEKESEGFVCPEPAWRPGEGAGRVHRPTWEDVPSGWRPKMKKKNKKNPQGLGETNHVTECNVTASGASVGGNKWMQTVSIKRRIDSRLKRVVPRFLPTPLLSAESTKWSRSKKRASHPQTSTDTKDFSYLPKLNAVVGYVHFPNDRKWLNKLLKSVLSKESWMFGFLP